MSLILSTWRSDEAETMHKQSKIDRDNGFRSRIGKIETHTSRRGNHLLPSDEMALHSKVIATKRIQVCHAVAVQIALPSLSVKILTQPMINRVVPKLTDKVIVMLPSV